MKKLSMCRICLVEDVRMHVVVDKNLHELNEKLTDIPLNPLINLNQLEDFWGLAKGPIEQISIVDELLTKNIAIKEELSAVCEELDDITEPTEGNQSDLPGVFEELFDVIESKEENQSVDLEPENVEYSCVEEIPQNISDSTSDSDDDVPLLRFKPPESTPVEDLLEKSKIKRSAVKTFWAPVTKIPKLEDTMTAELVNERSKLKVQARRGNRNFTRRLGEVRTHILMQPTVNVIAPHQDSSPGNLSVKCITFNS